MLRTISFGGLFVAGLLTWATAAQAQLFVKAPFTRVVVGNGVQVQTPFLNLQTPPLPGPAVPTPIPLVPGPEMEIPPAPSIMPAVRPMTLGEFAAAFDPKPGSYEVVLINPVTCQPTCVRFCLEKCVRRVIVKHDALVLRYGLCHAVRIDFTCHGAVVTRH